MLIMCCTNIHVILECTELPKIYSAIIHVIVDDIMLLYTQLLIIYKMLV